MMTLRHQFHHTALCIGLWCVISSMSSFCHADQVVTYPEYEQSLVFIQQDKTLEAAQILTTLAEQADPDRPDPNQIMAGVIATMLWEKLGNPKAYGTWAKSIEQYLRIGTNWQSTRQKLEQQLQQFKQAMVYPDADFLPVLKPEDRWLTNITQALPILQYDGPAGGLQETPPPPAPPINVSINYFGTSSQTATPLVRQSGDQTEIETPSTDAADQSVERNIVSTGTVSAPVDLPNSFSQALVPVAEDDSPPAPITETAPPPATVTNPPVTTTAIATTPINSKALPSPSTTAQTPSQQWSKLAKLPQQPIRIDPETLNDIAAIAWSYFVANKQPQTGLYNSKAGYPFATPWDMGHMLAGLVSAQQLSLISREDFMNDMGMLLATLRDLPLYNQALPNREYQTTTGQMIDFGNQISTTGNGWSALGIARLLTWLNITSLYYPEFSEAIQLITTRWNYSGMINQGQLRGAVLNSGGEQPFQEGRLGYEQYAAAGLSLYGIKLRQSQRYEQIKPQLINGIKVWLDQRPKSRTTSEPLYLGMIELGGIDGCFQQVAESHWQAQMALSKKTKAPIALSEESISQDPWFILNTVYSDDQEWSSVSRTGQPFPHLASYSFKAALAWYAVFPQTNPTWPINIVDRLATPNGFRAGIMSSGQNNSVVSLATNAVILESLWYISRNREPFSNISRSLISTCLTPDPATFEAAPDQP